MSVELTGPQAYDFQYLVTAYIALLHIEEANCKLIVEKKDGEDAELIIVSDAKEMTLEIQVKSTTNDLNIEELTSWLNHFPDRKSENNLIERLNSDDNRIALFITKGRGTDLIRPFLATNISENSGPFNNELLSNIVNNLESNNSSDSLLKEKRSVYSSRQARYFDNNKSHLRSICRRTLVWEMVSEDNIIDKCYDVLNKKFFVPLSKAKSALSETIELVKKARNERKDVIPSLEFFLRKYNVNQIHLNPVNVDRESIEEKIKILEENNVLLLTGISFCGKTHVAKKIGSELQYAGYNCLIEPDIKKATRFLLQNSMENRLCIIEDPFGQVELEDNYYEILSLLKDLINSLGLNRKIIVTSKIELLRRLSNSSDPRDWRLEGNEFLDLTVKDYTFIKKVWDAYCLEKKIPSDIASLISDSLKEMPEDNLLQPGQLKHLAYQNKTELLQMDIEDLIQVATVGGESLGMYFDTKAIAFKKVLVALGLGSSPSQIINAKELTYILSDSEEQPSLVFLEENYSTMEIPGRRSNPSFPEYELNTNLPDWVLEQLDELEVHGYISIIGDNILFTHPIYHEAAKYVINHQTRLSLRGIPTIINKGIACLEPDTSFMFTKQLRKLYLRYSSNQEFKEQLILSSCNSLNSIFPSVRDSAFIFLVSIIEDLSDQLQEKVYRFLKNEDIGNKRLLWRNGEPWINITSSYSLLDGIDALLGLENYMDVVEIAKKLIHPSESKRISSEEAWQVVSSDFLFEEEEDNIQLIKQLLTYKEAFIRSRIAFTAIKFLSNQDSHQLVELVFTDEHPNVVYQAMRGAISGWNEYSEDHRAFLLSYMKLAMSNKVVVANMSRFLIDFGDDYGTDHIDWDRFSENEKKKVWWIWSQIFHVFMENVPYKFVSLNESHLFDTVMKSADYIDSSEILKISKSWLLWIEKHLHNRLLHESGYAVCDYLIKNTCPDQRKELSGRILNQVDTNFISVALAEYINQWDILSNEERQKIMLLLQSGRDDARWLKAVSLTRTKVPAAIAYELVGDKCIFEKEINDIIKCFPGDLLTDCLSVFTGDPQPLWWLGYHHTKDTKWPQVLQKLLEIPEHPSFEIAFKSFLERFIEGSFRGQQRIEVLEIWKNIVLNKSEFHERLFRELEYKCISYNGADSEDLWRVFLENLNPKKKSHYLKEIIQNIEAYIYFDEIYEVVGKKLFQEEILPKLPFDKMMIEMILQTKDILDDELNIEHIIPVVEALYSEKSPRLNLTNEIVEHFFSEIENEKKNDLLRLIKKSNEQISKEGEKKRESIVENYDKNYSYPISDWTSKYQEK